MTGKRKPIEEAWDSFAKAALPPETSSIQRDGMRSGFYAGAISLFKILMDTANDGEEQPIQDNLNMMNDVEANLADFVRELSSG